MNRRFLDRLTNISLSFCLIGVLLTGILGLVLVLGGCSNNEEATKEEIVALDDVEGQGVYVLLKDLSHKYYPKTNNKLVVDRNTKIVYQVQSGNACSYMCPYIGPHGYNCHYEDYGKVVECQTNTVVLDLKSQP